jgi:hypothetical protein
MTDSIHGPASTRATNTPTSLGMKDRVCFVDLGGGLEDADHQADDQGHQQQRRRHHQGDFHGRAAHLR